MKTLEILVIEDNQKHLQDVKAEISKRIEAGSPIRVDYASTLDEAMRYTKERKYLLMLKKSRKIYRFCERRKQNLNQHSRI